MLSLVTLALLALAFVILYVSGVSQQPPKGLKHVPGPSGWPVVGNTLQLESQPQRQFQAWAQQYGELFKIKIGWYDWIFVNDPGAVKELFDKQSAVTSGRVPMPVASGLISGGKRFLLMSYTPEWRKLRAIVHKLLTPKISDTFKPSQEFEAKQLIYDIYQDSQKNDLRSFYMHVRRYTTSVVMTSTYGKRIPQWDCEDVHEVYGVMKEFSDATAPGAFIADMIPPLADIIPVWMQWWRKRALLYSERQTRLWMKYWNNLQRAIGEKRAPDCFVKQFVETDYVKQGIDEVQAAYVAGTMIEAGSETTSSALNSAIKYLAAFPLVQQKANEELTRVVGDSRSPKFEDEADLPYIRAMVKEILRIRPTTNIGTPHFTTADVKYKDFYIPKGTVLSISQYALHFDARYERPEEFNPDRYLNHPLKAGAYTAHPDPFERDHFGFGAGRRICPGMHLAENSLFITLAKLLWAFEIIPALDRNGKPEHVDVTDNAYENGGNTLPKPYRMSFRVRNETRQKLIVAEWESARDEGYYLGSTKVDASGVVVGA